MNHLPSKTQHVAALLSVALTNGCGAIPSELPAAGDGEAEALDGGYRPPERLPADAGRVLPYMRGARADLDRPDAGVAQALNAAQIVGVLSVFDIGQIRQGNLAQAQAVDARVRGFGTRMVMAHTDSAEHLRALSQRLRIVPAESSLGQLLRVQGAETATRLSSLGGEIFDREYVTSQVLEHTRAIEVIDGLLVPNAADEALRTALQNDVRPAVMAHWGQARDLQSELTAP